MCRFVHSFDAHRGAICFCFVIAIVYFVTYKSGQFFFEVMFRMFLFWILFLGHNSIVCNFFLFSSFDLYTHTHSALLLFSSTLCDVVWSASLFAKLAVNSSFGVVVVLTLKNQSTFCWMLFLCVYVVGFIISAFFTFISLLKSNFKPNIQINTRLYGFGFCALSYANIIIEL